MFRGRFFSHVSARRRASLVLLPIALLACSGFAVVETRDETADVAISDPTCHKAQRATGKFDVDTSRVYTSGVLTLGGWRVPFREDGFVAKHKSDPSLTQAFYSAGWLVPQSRADVSRAIDLFIEMSRANPDPGNDLDGKAFAHVGWAEAAVTLRLKTALCLYRIADSDAERASLLPAIDALLVAARDEERYYGPPTRKPHNHGVMADRELLNAAETLDRPELAAFAKNRLMAQIDGLYDSCGFTYEQSNGYQHFHASLWTQIAWRVENDPAFHRRVLETIPLVRQAANAVTFPNGFTPVIGNGVKKAAADLTMVQGNLALLCPDTGWFSWRQKRGGVQQQVIARFGPGTRFHGHSDKGSIVWFAHPSKARSGVEVLADRGLPGKNRNAAYDYAVGPKAHATLLWGGGSDLRLSGDMDRSGDKVTMEMAGGNIAGGYWDRTVTMHSARTTLTIEDRLGGRAATRPATQNFPLDPVWEKTERSDTYKTAEGLSLVITCATATGSEVPVKQSRVLDHQLSSPRSAFTASCTIPKGALGARAVLSVSLS